MYLLAESLQFAQVGLSVYRGAKGESSPQREFLRALMLAPTPTFVPQHVQGVCRPSGARRQTGLSAACAG